MHINEFHTFNIKDAVKFHKELNPKIFNPDKKMDSEVRDQLLVIAKDFIAELGIKGLDVEDITVSGSNAAYSYTDNSDLDLHILVDFSKLPHDEVYQELFLAKKTVYNDSHDITVRGIPVELYVQDSNQPHITLGEYSLLNNKWTRIPTKDRANFNQIQTQAKYEKLLDLIKRAIASKDYEKVQKAWDTLKRYRKAGLESAGEFGPENLAYKALRNQGYVQKLYNTKNKLHSKKLSIDEAGADMAYYDPKAITQMAGDSKKNLVSKLQKLKGMLSQETDETKILYQILRKLSKKQPVTPEEKTAAKQQSYDLLKLAGLSSTAWIPGQTLAIFFAEKLAKRFGMSILPSAFKNLVSETEFDEDWHPNDTPPGPEFKPTMPKGTVRVDVSDVYDWYKLGQNISNLDRVDKSKFGKGPPSTIMAFGDEDIEHKYINALKQLGLDTTDIDPVDPKQPKGMPRQKIDPTYNVQESASGYIPSYAEKDDPRFKTALTVDIKPDSLKKNAQAFGFNISRAGIPPDLRASGKYKRIKKK